MTDIIHVDMWTARGAFGAAPDHYDGRPLAGVRVVDMTTSYAGPTASMYLADLGAEVIKVERPGHGDDTRTWGPPFVDGVSAWFASANRGKRSVVLNLSSPGGQAVLYRLVGQCDVFMENMVPSKLARLGLDPATLRAAHPRLIYCAMSGFGLDGPDAAMPGYDLIAQARSGLMSVTGPKDGVPQRVSTALSDVVTGMTAVLAICATLRAQALYGVGETIDVSLLDSDLALMAPRLASYMASDPEPAPSGGTDSVLAVYQRFATKTTDIVLAVGNDEMWQRVCDCLGLPVHPDELTNVGRRAKRTEIAEAVQAALTQDTAENWLSAFAANGVPAANIQFLGAVVSDPQVVARRSIFPLPGSEGLYGIRAPWRLAGQGDPVAGPVPLLGSDTVDVLTTLGYQPSEIEDLIASGAVGVAEGRKSD